MPILTTQYASNKPIDDWTSSKTRLGAASLNSVATMGPSGRRAGRGLTLAKALHRVRTASYFIPQLRVGFAALAGVRTQSGRSEINNQTVKNSDGIVG